MKKKRYNHILLVALILLVCSFQTDSNLFYWREGKLLTWNDFNGKPEKRFAAASTHYDIYKTVSKSSEKSAIVKIEAVFFKNKSWKKQKWINDQVLSHEQKHFDIVELYARKLRKVISETKFKNYAELTAKVDELYDINDKEMDIYQDKYDNETDGSMNGDKQREWEKKVMMEISDLNKFKDVSVDISFN